MQHAYIQVFFFSIFEVSKWRSKTVTYDGRSNQVIDTKNDARLENIGQNRGDWTSREAL